MKQVLQLTINHKALYLGISCFVGFSMKFATSLLLSLLSKQFFLNQSTFGEVTGKKANCFMHSVVNCFCVDFYLA